MVNERVISDTACVVSDLKSEIVHMAYFFFFLSVRTACSDPKIGTHYFHPLALISAFWSTETVPLHLNGVSSVIAVSVILSDELSSYSELSNVCALFIFVRHTVLYVTGLLCADDRGSE